MNPEELKKKLNEWLASMPTKQEPSLPQDKYEIIQSRLGYSGRMLSSSKRPVQNKDGRMHLAVWNANLIVDGYGKVWFGDVDITNDEDELKAIAQELKAKVYVLREIDARFGTENNPKLQDAVYVTDGVISEIPNSSYAQNYERDAETGAILSKRQNG